MRKPLLWIFLIMIGNLSPVQTASWSQVKAGGKTVEGRAVWAHPSSVAFNDSAVQAFVNHCKRANINLIVLLTEFSDKQVFYHSKKFPETIAEAFKNFDPLAAVVREAHKRGIRVHAWLCNFTQSDNGPVMQQHPEWAVRNPEGKIPSQAEFLGEGAKYYINWMCPARRPGYTDQWMLPMIEEIVTNYAVDGIHHDYVRYPGDVAPDSYCFCDYCLEDMLKYAHLYYETYPDSVYAITPALPNMVANWWSDPTVKPKGWDQWDRKKKADFFLSGSFIKGGPTDLNYFFYTYRQDAITRFAREAWERASSIKPSIEFSAAVFKNPIASGRFIGQRWTDFAPWVDIMMPMVYRSHFPQVDYDVFLKQLEEYTQYEYQWAKDKCVLSIGLDVHYIFNEERLPLQDMLKALAKLSDTSVVSREGFIEQMKAAFGKIEKHLASVDPALAAEIGKSVANVTEKSLDEIARLRDRVQKLDRDPPPGYYPGEKLRRAIEAVRAGGANGFVIFDAGGLTSRKLWPTLEEVFKEPSIDQDKLASAAAMSVVRLRTLNHELKCASQLAWILGALSALLLAALVIVVVRRRAHKG